ncbi:hypothetical protein WJX72_011550 [[Myrmecia] bisecta]|uniref:Uncharacterized protein n=1 Tax=[Myrmecia] bisecta TaxID=41462 RepID=A0AAW1P7L0_9CHLO
MVPGTRESHRRQHGACGSSSNMHAAPHAEQASKPTTLPCQLVGARSAACFLESHSMRIILDSDFVDGPVEARHPLEPDSCGTPISTLFDQRRPGYLPDQGHHRMTISVPNDAVEVAQPPIQLPRHQELASVRQRS